MLSAFSLLQDVSSAFSGFMLQFLFIFGIGVVAFGLHTFQMFDERRHRNRDHDLRLHEAAIRAAGVEATRAGKNLSPLPQAVPAYVESRARLQPAASLAKHDSKAVSPESIPQSAPEQASVEEGTSSVPGVVPAMEQSPVLAEETAILATATFGAHISVGNFPELGIRTATLHFGGQAHNLTGRKGIVLSQEDLDDQSRSLDQKLIDEAYRLGEAKLAEILRGKRSRRARKSKAA